MHVVIGHSDDIDSQDAATDVIAQCRSQLGDRVPKAALLFMSVDYDHRVVLAKIADAWPGLPLIGGSSDGEISSQSGYLMDSVLLTLICGDNVFATTGLGRNLSTDIDASTLEAHRSASRPSRTPGTTGDAIPANTHGSPDVVLTLFSPSTNASEVLRSLNRTFGSPPCPILGGLTGDHREIARMVEFHGTEVLSDSLPILCLYGNVAAGWGLCSGWKPLDRAYPVTRSAGHIVMEIDGKPAIDIYEQNYGQVPQGTLGEYPLALYDDDPDGTYVLRAVLGTDRDSGEVRFVGEIPEGSWVRMTQVLDEGILSGTKTSVGEALERFPGTRPEIGLVFSCAARKWVLGSRAEQEIRVLREFLSARGHEGTSIAGLYVYGEVAPLASGQPSKLHNDTCLTVLLGPRTNA